MSIKDAFIKAGVIKDDIPVIIEKDPLQEKVLDAKKRLNTFKTMNQIIGVFLSSGEEENIPLSEREVDFESIKNRFTLFEELDTGGELCFANSLRKEFADNGFRIVIGTAEHPTVVAEKKEADGSKPWYKKFEYTIFGSKVYVSNKERKQIYKGWSDERILEEKFNTIVGTLYTHTQERQNKNIESITAQNSFQHELHRTHLLKKIDPDSKGTCMWVNSDVLITKNFAEQLFEERRNTKYMDMKEKEVQFENDYYFAFGTYHSTISLELLDYTAYLGGEEKVIGVPSYTIGGDNIDKITIPENCLVRYYNGVETFYFVHGTRESYERVIDHINHFPKVQQLLKDLTLNKFE